MSRLISSLPLGSLVKFNSKDNSVNNLFKVISQYAKPSHTMLYLYETKPIVRYNGVDRPTYEGSDIQLFLKRTYENLPDELKNIIGQTAITCLNTNTNSYYTLYEKLFLLSDKELNNSGVEGQFIPYFTNNSLRALPDNQSFWLRTLVGSQSARDFGIALGFNRLFVDNYSVARYALNVSNDIKVTDNPQSDGAYHLVWNAPPLKPTIDTLSTDQNNPSITSLTETITFKTTDSDGDTIESFNIVVKDITTNTEVVNETKNQSELSFKILYGSLQPNKIYSIKVRVKDDQQNWSEFSDLSYMINKTFMITLDKNVILNDGDQIEFVEMDAITNGQEMALKSIDNENKKYVFELDELNNATTVNLEIKSKSNNLEDILYTVS